MRKRKFLWIGLLLSLLLVFNLGIFAEEIPSLYEVYSDYFPIGTAINGRFFI